MADGFSLNIDDKFLQNLDKADAKLTKIVEKSEQMQTKVTEAFAKSSQGMQVLIDKLNEANTSLSKLGSSKVQNSVVSAIGKQASQSVDVVNKLITALNQLTQENAKMKNDESKRKKENSEVANINALYRERIKLMKQLEGIVQTGMKSGKVAEGESSSIASIRQRIQVVEMEIQAYNKRTNLSKEALRALTQGEVDYTLAEANEIRKRNKITEEETNKKRQEAEKQEQARTKAEERATKQAQAEADKRARQAEKEANQAKRQADKKAESASKAAQREARALDTRNINAYNRAMASSEATITQRINKLAKLRQVQEQLSQDENKYANQLSKIRSEIERLTQANEKQEKSAKKVEKSHRNLMDTAGQLERKLALLFSVSAIQGYVNKLIEVRGEFEMQQRSLQVLLQNKDEANALWDKTVALAVKSPFRIKDLVTYTKQLAAYRVESDKLYETNRMLADVSAGLGVDMNRLILAFGQVKAANYLRGTELRQFSEAGVNMLGELAKYFTELEGRAVSVGDVFERVSKRMVSFENVNEIFRRLTSEGGVFFKMQEKQSETLKGMVMNFRDSMDLMLNDIGKDQDSILKDSIRLAKEFVDNWRKFEPLMKTIGTSFLSAFGVKALMNIANGLSKLWAIASAHPFIAIASAVALVVTYIYQAAQAQTKLNAAMQEVENENLASLEESIGLYKQLTQTINDTTKSYEERNKAMSQLKSKFNEILPNQYTELKYVEQLGGNYRDAEQAMLDYYNAKTREQKKSRVEQEFAGELEGTDIPELIKSTRGYIDSLYDANKITQDVQVKLNAGVSRVINSIVDDMKSGKLGASIENFHKEFSNRISKFSGIDWESLGGGNFVNSLFRQEDIQDVISTLGKYQDALESIEGLAYETYDQQEAAKMINQEKNNLNTAVNAFKKAASLYQKYVDAIPDATGTVEEKRKKIESDVQKILTDLPKGMEAYGEYLNVAFGKLKTEADKGAFAFASALQTIESELYYSRDTNGVLDGLAGVAFNNVALNESANDAAKQMVENFKEGLEAKASTLAMNDFQKAAIKGAEIIAEKFKVSTNNFAKFVPKYGESLSDVRQRVKAEIENMIALLEAYNLSITTGASMLSEKVLSTTKEQAQHMTTMIPVLQEYLKYLGESEKGGKNKRDKLMDERIKVIDDMNKKYKELNKTLSKTESLQGAFDAYKDAFADAYGRNDVKQMTAEEFASKVLNFPNENDIVKWLDNLAKTAKNKEDKIKVELAKGEYVFDMKVRVKEESDKALIDQIEDMFSGYEMSIELQKMNIPPDLAKQLFNIDSLTLPELKDKLIELKPKFEGKDMLDKWKELMQKIDEMEDKANLERLKKFAKFLSKTTDAIANIQKQGALDITYAQNLFLGGKIDAEKYSEIIKNVVSEVNKDISKINLEKFKESPEYIAAMGDMAGYTVSELSKLSNKIRDLISENAKSMTPDEIKAYNDALNKINEQVNKIKSPFGKSWLSELREINSLEKELTKEKEKQLRLQQELQNKQSSLTALTKKLEDLQSQPQSAGRDIQIQGVLGDIQKVQNGISQTNGQLNTTAGNISNIGDKLQGILQGMGTSVAAVDKIIKGISQSIEATIQMFNDFKSMMDTFGVETDKGAWQEISLAMETLGEVNQKATQGWEDLKSGNIAGAVANTVGVVTSLISGINKIHDAKYERRIQREAEFVESLQHEYEKLGKAIEDAYSIDTLEKSGKKAKDNLQSQIQSYYKMIDAEEDKKDTDDDRIKEWKYQIEELKQQIEDLNKDLVNTATAGILDSVLSASQEFTDAWLEAFNETGDGLSGLSDNFKETMLEMVKQQAAMLISQAYVEKWKKQLEQYINPDDLELSTDEAKKWVDAVSSSLPQLNDALTRYFEAMQSAGVDLGGGSDTLSGLQKGIQSVSESTAQIIEAYLNSVRFYVADSNSKLTMIANQIVGSDETTNPMLSELRSQTELIRSIRDMFGSVIKQGHSTFGGAFLKVSL